MNDSPDIAAPPFQVLLYYRYFEIDDPVAYVEEHRSLCESLGLRGRIIVAEEGINGTVSGATENTERYMASLPEIEFKIDPANQHVFPKLSVKVRDEIVTLGLPDERDIDPNSITGGRLSPREFFEAMQDDDVVVIDGRNDYEAQLGHFKNAVCPPLQNFREFPDWLHDNAEDFRGKKILTYCTGGIRCEKLSGFIKKEGFEEVYQLDGGIVKYGKDPEVQGRDFEGLCYVFDQRVGIEVNQTETRKVVTHCRHCGTEEPRYGNCRWPECNEQIFVCPECREEHGLFCGEECRRSAEQSGKLPKEKCEQK